MFSRDLIREMDHLRREIDDAFRGFGGRRGFDSLFMPGVGQRGYPLINVRSDQDTLYVDALLPGVEADGVEITVQQNTLTITGERKPSSDLPEGGVWHRRERGGGKFLRTVELPVDVDTDKVKAEYRNGLLHVILPKAAAARPTRVQISAE